MFLTRVARQSLDNFDPVCVASILSVLNVVTVLDFSFMLTFFNDMANNTPKVVGKSGTVIMMLSIK